MTDKQIIIDGVDVSGCEWFYKNDPCKNTCKYFCTPCEWVEIQNCMYKYAKRKEQECEELKDKLSCCFCNPNVSLNDIEKQRKCIEVTECFRRKLDQLKKENDELKSTNKIYEQGIARLKDEKNNLKKENNSLKETIDGLLSIQYKLADNRVKYSQTLAGIKELLLQTSTDSQEHCVNAKSVILQKINEVIDE